MVKKARGKIIASIKPKGIGLIREDAIVVPSIEYKHKPIGPGFFMYITYTT